MNKIFIGNLSYNTNDDGLREAFEGFGTVKEAIVILDRETGRSRGFGFVTFTSSDEANEAISAMHEADLDGRTIAVNQAKERAPRRDGGGGGGGGGYGGGGGGRNGGGRNKGHRH